LTGNATPEPRRLFELFQDEKTAVFIDGSNVYETVKSLNFDIDYKNLREYFLAQCNLVRINYYTAVLPPDQESPLKPLVDYLSYNGYKVVTRLVKQFEDKGGTRIKGNMDIDLAVDVMLAAKHLDHIIIFSGDSDFQRLISAVQEHHQVRVTVVSSKKTTPPIVSDELRREADYFVEIADLRPYISKESAYNRSRPSSDENGIESNEITG
jgi:uncharacterized LabA/DUF88 family protein